MRLGTEEGCASAAADTLPRVSVIITNYNYGRFLGTAIESVLAQTHADVECVVVDDGSTDESREVARRYGSIRLVAKPNGGQVSAGKAGMAVATGPLVIFLDADDRLYPDACSRVATDYEPAITLYQYALDKVTPDGARVGGYPDAPLIVAGHAEHLERHGYFPSSPTSGNAFAAEHVRRMFAETVPELTYGLDGYLIYSAPFFGKVLRSDHVIGCYLVHGGNVSLSAGLNRRSAERAVSYAYWQRTGITTALRLTGQTARPTAEYLTAYHLRHLLILRRCYGVRDIAPAYSGAAIARAAIGKFARDPHMRASARLKNILLVVATCLGDRRLGRRAVPPLPPAQALPC